MEKVPVVTNLYNLYVESFISFSEHTFPKQIIFAPDSKLRGKLHSKIPYNCLYNLSILCNYECLFSQTFMGIRKGLAAATTFLRDTLLFEKTTKSHLFPPLP